MRGEGVRGTLFHPQRILNRLLSRYPYRGLPVKVGPALSLVVAGVLV